ncbi:LuxR C-terminal-related transcriptional regulator [Skermania piniformis]|uniref:LuxR C-terminal-related transcriptional regulator n=1 Tax=Skermania pinensis TaxID=39122 RepID=A0ABX8S7G7_9ACTN|nr:LuxR C-terminal-related transcriptional regulator [Skermania piniformis]QXQ13780.1 LuxR C-terminal-related transcriptional regulator [Skermania piniformis]
MPRVPRFSDREVDVIRTWLLSGTKAEAAGKLYLSIGTVNTHLARIRHKYEAAGRPANDKAALLARALIDRLVTLAELERCSG